MMSPEKKLADATGIPTARESDVCMRKHDQWCYVAGDTFFCQFSDALIGRKTASLEISSPEIDQSQTRHQGLTKRTQIPRDKNGKKQAYHVVPEIETDESNAMISDEEHFNYDQVPVFYPFSGQQIPSDTQDVESEASFDQLNSINPLIIPSDFKFAADHKESFQTEEPAGVNKFEDEKSEVVWDNDVGIYDGDTSYKGEKMLKLLDYEGIIGGWDNDRSPWTTGDRPEFEPNDHCMIGCGKICGSGDMTVVKYDAEREARVSRYREKRQTRLFSKKIRYEVRKLNAEKRPRMKGRFVKKTISFSTVGFIEMKD